MLIYARLRTNSIYNINMEHILYTLAKRYPQVYLPIEEGISKSEEYKETCLRGEQSKRELLFSFNPKDKLETVNTIAGDVEILTMYDRLDFEHIIKAIAYRGEPEDIPSSTGAMALFGLNNWEKVRAGLDNYKDSFIILSAGRYSNVSNEDIKKVTNNELSLSDEEWIEKSIIIRKYHELTHFVMRKLYPEDIKPIRDELIADCIGLICAFNELDPRLLKLFLGLENNTYRKGGRLENYKGFDENNITDVLSLIDNIVLALAKYEHDDINTIWQHICDVL